MKRILTLATLLLAWAFAGRADELVPAAPSTNHNETPAASGANSSPGWADRSHRFGIGALFGEPTALSLKYFFNRDLAIDGAVGWSFESETDWHLHSDVLWHINDLVEVPDGNLALYFGGGVRLKFREHADDRFGIRVPVGVSYMFDRAPVDVFAEIAPILDLTPSTRGAFNAGIGVRWWF